MVSIHGQIGLKKKKTMCTQNEKIYMRSSSFKIVTYTGPVPTRTVLMDGIVDIYHMIPIQMKLLP